MEAKLRGLGADVQRMRPAGEEPEVRDLTGVIGD
jgi:hypothetical protein